IEINAVLRDRDAAEAIAVRLSNSKGERIEQEDVFFHSEHGRLKLRVLSADKGELIWHDRRNESGPRCSEYLRARTADPGILREIMAQSMQIKGVVRKVRKLYLIGQRRVHIDEIESLGSFIELEVVLQPNQSEAEGKRIAEFLISKFQAQIRQVVGEA